MRITFITNYMTHHQLPFAEEMYRLLGDDFTFIATNRMEEERLKMGWGIENQDKYPYVGFFDDDMAGYGKLLRESDVVICGGTHDMYIRERLQMGRITFRYFERLYKKGQWRAFTPRGYLRKWKEHTAQKDKPVYLLCAGAYVASDFRLFGAYSGKMLKWGYFPEFISYDIEKLMDQKKSCNILWTGRMIHWKHAEDALKAVMLLLRQHKAPEKIHLTMVGDGECVSLLREMIDHKVISGIKLSDAVTIQAFVKPKEVRALMEESDIYLMTSDHEEGWGAVVNEAMNSGCAVIASSAAGSVPYLIHHKKNGLVYRSGNVKELAANIMYLLDNPAAKRQIGTAAYRTIENLWNPCVAAKRMLRFCEGLMEDAYRTEEEGPLSEAELLSLKQGYAYCRR